MAKDFKGQNLGDFVLDDELGRLKRSDGYLSIRAVKREKGSLQLDIRKFKFRPSGDEMPVAGVTVNYDKVPLLKEYIEEFLDRYEASKYLDNK